MMKILVAGATGLIGSVLIAYLQGQHQLGIVGRDVHKIKRQFGLAHDAYDWVMIKERGADILGQYDLVINLAGENIGDHRWSDQQKARILQSRVDATSQLAQAAVQSGNTALRFFNAGAIGVYGFAQDTVSQSKTIFTESSPSGSPADSFVATVACAWEAALSPAKAAGLSVLQMRFAVVLAKEGGALRKMLPSFKLGLGAVLGSGGQPFSWIALHDVVRAINFLIDHRQISGTINLVAPGVVTQRELAKTLAHVLHRPCLMHLPGWVVHAMFGEMADELLLKGQNVSGEKLVQLGFQFDYPNLRQALAEIV